jgi:EmrB/QacA subfamily drug resistance transporter
MSVATGTSESVGTALPKTAPAPAAWGLPLAVLIAGMFMSVLDVSIVNVAVPAIQLDFGATTGQIQWIATAYSLALGVVVPVSAWLGDRLGLTRLYIGSLLGFAAGSALCGLAWDLNSLIVFRVIQAIPGGILPVITLSMVYRIVPREKIGAAMGMYGLGIVFAPAVGPTLGGYLVEYVDWRLIFFINVPVGVLGALAAVAWLPRFASARAGKFDLPGFLAIAVGLFSLLLALSEGEDWGWSSYPVLILLTVGVLSMALFVVIELEVDRPLLDVRVFRYWPFTNSLLLISVLSVGLFGVLFYVPLYLQQGQGLGAFDAGLLLLPQALVMGALMPVAGRLYDRFGPRWPALIGLSILALGTYLMSGLTVDTPHSTLVYLLMFRAVGMGLAMMPIMTGGLSALPMSEVSRGSAFNNVVQRTSAAMGLAALTAVLTTQRAQIFSDRSGLMSTDTLMPGGTGGAGGAAAAAATGGSANGSGSGSMLEMYSMYQQTQTQVFIAALDELFVITAIVTLLGVVLAAFLRHGPAPAAPPAASSAAPAVAAESAAPSELAEPEPSSNGEGHAPAEDAVPRNGHVASPTREDEPVGS